MGHGVCTVMNKQAVLNASNGRATSDPLVIGQQAWLMLKGCNVDPKELRGVGIQLQKLEKAGSSASSGGEKAQRKLTDFNPPKPGADAGGANEGVRESSEPPSAEVDSTHSPSAMPKISVQPPSQEDDVQIVEVSATSDEPPLTENIPLILPSLSQVDPSTLEELPEDIRSEISKEYRRRRSESLTHSRSTTPARPLSLTDGSVLRDDEEEVLFQKDTPAKRKTTNKGTPLGRIAQALGPKGSSSISPLKMNIFERAKLAASTSKSSAEHSVASSSGGKGQPKKSSSVKVSMDELRSLGIDAQVYAALPVDLQLEQLSRARFERSFGKSN